ncbi:hypothetical protein DAPPUDRAFT_114122 [Daphnia pulex]|uniref:Cuticular protein n=1 Tax=Daphnia pulex TaxID=6669 RepID=E9HH46_DAPPU|nr:hypothetical protein DAPPUDRAFT_114122 [Daphnia pulex]|eukprot:EFX68943.1 hypothetical protein DAPPUDRAFT_114122 [Daphnia pulex]
MNWELRMILITLLAAAVSAAPPVNSAVLYAHEIADPAYAVVTVLYPSVPEPVQVAVQPKITYDFAAPIEKSAQTPVKVEYDILGPIAAPAPAPVVPVAAPVALPAPVKIEYRFPAPISVPAPAPVKVEYDFLARISAPAPAPVVAAPSVAYAAPAPVHVFPQALETRVHYAETPVVVGHTSTIMKPNLGAGAHVTNFDFMGLAQTKTVGQESFVQKFKVLARILAPVRTVSEITPQVTVQRSSPHFPTPYGVAVPTPYAQPVPVPVAP